MSRHNYYHNYQNYQKKNDQEQNQVEPEVEEIVESEVEVEEPTSEDQVFETLQVEPPKSITGVVKGCARLNVRVAPDFDAEVIGIINEGTDVEINEQASTEDFYSVCTVMGLHGFCMKKFIAIN